MTDLPEPLTPVDCNLRGMPFMPLDTERLLDSDMMALSTGEEFKTALRLWCKSWNQEPAASLPDDDRILAHLAGRELASWRKMRDMALRGFIKCNDGRLYHPVVAEKANRAWKKKQSTMRKVIRRLEIESGEWAAVRSAVFERDNYTCRYCGARGVTLECDHVVPVAQGGCTEDGNLVTACRTCNRAKGARTPEQWERA